MTGSKSFIALENGVRMDLSRNKSGANRLEITIDGTDTYTLRFYRYTRGRLNKNTFVYSNDKIKEIKSFSDVYADQLQKFFTDTTGLDTHL
jgi:hypothetical protein